MFGLPGRKANQTAAERYTAEIARAERAIPALTKNADKARDEYLRLSSIRFGKPTPEVLAAAQTRASATADALRVANEQLADLRARLAQLGGEK